jgi:hypothetical protein
MPLLGATGGGSAKGFGALANLGYFIRNSLRFRGSATGYLTRTPGSAGNRKTWTWSAWIKIGTISTNIGVLFGAQGQTAIYLNDGTYSSFRVNGAAGSDLITNLMPRDPSAWYHLVVACDTTQATEANRLKIYVNGVQQTSFQAGSAYPTLNGDTYFNSTALHTIGRRSWNSDQQFDGYMAEINFIDGQALTPSSFGKTDTGTGQWVPRKFAGTYGTNGFYLKFADASAATAAAIGKDTSGNGNNWTPNNISVTAGTTYDAMIDSPTLSAAASNYPVINPLTGVTPTGGNLNLSGGDIAGIGTMAFPSTGKWYFEMVCGSGVTTTSLDSVGIGTTDINGGLPVDSTRRSIYMYRSNGVKLSIINNGSSSQVSYGATFVNGDVIGVAFDCDADTLTFYKNNTSQGTAFTSILSTTPATPFFLTVYARGSGGTSNVSLNAGQRPFAYTPPTGFKSLNAFNLP